MARVEFDSTKKSLDDLLKKARDGSLQLPDFQRGWVWDDEGLRSILASISQSFPVGTLMTLKYGGEIRFKPRLIEGVDSSSESLVPESLLLDGQQRITSLFQTAMRQQVVETINTKRQRIKRFYFIDMARALDETVDRMDAVFGLPESKIEYRDFGREIVKDLSKEEYEYKNMMFPTNKIFDWNDWSTKFLSHWEYAPEKTKFWFEFLNKVLMAFHQYQMPVIELGKNTSREAVCLVFEKVNTGGKKLDAFELLTAIYAGEEEGFRLREDWAARSARLTSAIALREHPLTRVQPTEFFQALSLVYTYNLRNKAIGSGVGGDSLNVKCTRDAILRLPLQGFKEFAESVEAGFIAAGKFLYTQNIYWYKDVPYQSQIVPLAAILSILKERFDEGHVRSKLERWYWCGVFGELYGGAVETRFAKDLVDVIAWAGGGEEPTSVQDAAFRAERLSSMTSRLSAAYKGVHALLMREGARDFRSGQLFEHTVYFEENVDIHHVFPRAWCEKNGKAPEKYNSILNKTPINGRTNKLIGGGAPSEYLNKLISVGSGSEGVIDRNLLSHMINPDHLKSNDFEAFLDARREALLALIEKVMGKAIYRGVAVDEPIGAVVEEE